VLHIIFTTRITNKKVSAYFYYIEARNPPVPSPNYINVWGRPEEVITLPTPKKKGTSFENYIKGKILKEIPNAFILRSLGSKTSVDLLVFIDRTPIAVQCKATDNLDPLKAISKTEREKLTALFERHGIIPILATKLGGRVVYVNLVIGDAKKSFLEAARIR